MTDTLMLGWHTTKERSIAHSHQFNFNSKTCLACDAIVGFVTVIKPLRCINILPEAAVDVLRTTSLVFFRFQIRRFYFFSVLCVALTSLHRVTYSFMQ